MSIHFGYVGRLHFDQKSKNTDLPCKINLCQAQGILICHVELTHVKHSEY